jgi:TolA-binding protein
MPDERAHSVGDANSVGDEAYRLPTDASPVSATTAPTLLAPLSETETAPSVSERNMQASNSPVAGSESEDTSSLEGVLRSLRRRMEEQERMLRGIQSRYDHETARLRQQLKEQRRRATEDIASQMQSAGAAASQIAAFRQARTQEDTMQESREQASPFQAQPAPVAGNPAAQIYVRAMCEAADVDPNDPRLDLSTPDAFRASLNQIGAERGKSAEQREQSAEHRTEPEGPPVGQNPERKPKERERRSPRQDLDVLGGGGGGAIHELPDDLDELWKLAKKATPSLRERS